MKKEKHVLKKCEKCRGAGKIIKLNIKKAVQENVTCDRCRGIGFEQPEGMKGFQIMPQPGTPNWLCWYNDREERTACMFTLVRAIAKNPQDPNKFLHINIHSMFTPEKHRKKGYMSTLLEHVKKMAGGLVKFIITSYDDSSFEGRVFLMERGFFKKDGMLIWERGRND